MWVRQYHHQAENRPRVEQSVVRSVLIGSLIAWELKVVTIFKLMTTYITPKKDRFQQDFCPMLGHFLKLLPVNPKLRIPSANHAFVNLHVRPRFT